MLLYHQLLNHNYFFFYLFVGLKNVNDSAFTGNKDSDGGNGSNIEQQKEVQETQADITV